MNYYRCKADPDQIVIATPNCLNSGEWDPITMEEYYANINPSMYESFIRLGVPPMSDPPNTGADEAPFREDEDVFPE